MPRFSDDTTLGRAVNRTMDRMQWEEQQRATFYRHHPEHLADRRRWDSEVRRWDNWGWPDGLPAPPVSA